MTVSLRRASYGQCVSYLYTHLPLVFHYIKIRKEAVLKMETMETMEPVKEDRTNGKEQNPPTEKVRESKIGKISYLTENLLIHV